ncbi:MAG: glycosyltransferase family 2 protein [Kiritimatiellia bacterium]
MPRVTVVIPLYNKALEIERAVQSVLRQTEKDFHVVVVDDGSTDDGPERVLSISDSRIELVRQENCGVSVARNRGVARAETEFVAFLDADDEWLPDFLSETLALAKRHPQALLQATAYAMMTPLGRVIKPRLVGIPDRLEGGIIEDLFASAFRGDCPLCASNVLVRKSVFARVGGFPEGEKLGEDWDMWARIALAGSIAYVPKVQVIYHLEATNRAMNRLRHSGADTCLVRTLRQAIREKRFEQTSEKSLKAFLSEQLVQLARAALFYGDGRRARELLCEAEGYGVIRRHWLRMRMRSYLGLRINRLLDSLSQLERQLRLKRRGPATEWRAWQDSNLQPSDP